MTKTIADRISELRVPVIDKRAREADFLETLPADLPAPTVTLQRDGCFWLSFRPSYGEPYNPAEILRRLEDTLEPAPATLCRYADWLPHPEPYDVDDVPETNGRDKLTECWPMAPLWVDPNYHTAPEAITYYRAPGIDKPIRVSVELNRGLVCVTAQRKKTHGDWHYERGTARLRHPEAWHSLGRVENIGAVAGIHAKSFGRVCPASPQSTEGRLYFEPWADPFPYTPAQMLEAMLDESPSH